MNTSEKLTTSTHIWTKKPDGSAENHSHYDDVHYSEESQQTSLRNCERNQAGVYMSACKPKRCPLLPTVVVILQAKK